jgi:hypothetical protein
MKDEDRCKGKHIKMTFDALEKLGIVYFSYGFIFKGNVLNSCFSHDEWGKLYKEKQYNKIDPLFIGVQHSNIPLIVWDAVHPSSEKRKVMMERNEICRIKSGLTIGIKNKEGKEIIALGADIIPKEFYKLLKEEKYVNALYETLGKFYVSYKEELTNKH